MIFCVKYVSMKKRYLNRRSSCLKNLRFELNLNNFVILINRIWRQKLSQFSSLKLFFLPCNFKANSINFFCVLRSRVWLFLLQCNDETINYRQLKKFFHLSKPIKWERKNFSVDRNRLSWERSGGWKFNDSKL